MNEEEMLDKDLILLLNYIYMKHQEDTDTAGVVLEAYLNKNTMQVLKDKSKLLYYTLADYSHFLGLKDPEPFTIFEELFDVEYFEGVYQQLKKSYGDAPSA